MKKIFSFIAVAVFLIFHCSGCVSFYNSVPAEHTPVALVPVNVNTSYKILGPTEGKADLLIILGFITIGDSGNAVFPVAGVEGKGFSIPMPRGPKSKAECAAAYNALENHSGADRLLDPRWKTEITDYFFFKKIKSKCYGTALQIVYK